MLTITQKADEYIRKTGMQEIRFGVKTNKGCAGFEYIWQQGYPSINDYRININDNYTLLIDKSLKKYVDDCEIDLETLDDKLGNKIVFNNEKVEVKCGCGESLDFPDDIEENDIAWDDVQTYRFFYTEESWMNMANKNDQGGLSLNPKSVEIETKIKNAGDTVSVMTDKYKRWRKE